ncbi:MAG: hypothetical protein DRJ47_01650 [Thermoprotei archaeon]|nr:MAG: hypothetical protein DRJ47_01650 [Thermoprotei archaeon]
MVMFSRVFEGRWIIFTFLVLYVMTFMVSVAFLVFFGFLRLVVPWIPPAVSLSNWPSFIWFSLVFSLGFSLTAVVISIVWMKKRKTVDDYIRETLN